MNKITLVAALLISGCCSHSDAKQREKETYLSNQLKMECIKVARDISMYRCVNQEVLCYVGASNKTMQCHFKNIEVGYEPQS